MSNSDKFKFNVSDGIEKSNDISQIKSYLDKRAKKYFMKGLDASMKSSYEIIENTSTGFKIRVDKETAKNITGINFTTKNMTEMGQLIGESLFRTSDLDPKVRDTFYESDGSREQEFSLSKLKEWIVKVKLPRDFTEWSQLAVLDSESYEKKLDSIAYLVAREIFTGGAKK